MCHQVNYNWFNLTITDETVQVTITGLTKGCPLPTSASITRVDSNHTSTLAAWVAMGSPTYPTPAQIAQLNDLSALKGDALPLTAATGSGYGVSFTADMPPLSVAVVSFNRC